MDELKVNTLSLIQKRVTIKGWPSGSAMDSEETVNFSLRNNIEVEMTKFSLKDCDKAYKAFESGKQNGRVVLLMD